MKRIIFLLCFILAFSSCEDEPNPGSEKEVAVTVQDSIRSYKGDFITAGDAAVLKGSDFIYQVKMDSTAIALKDSLEVYKSQSESLVPVKVMGKVIKNPSSIGYSQIIEIKEVVEVLAQRQEDKKQK